NENGELKSHGTTDEGTVLRNVLAGQVCPNVPPFMGLSPLLGPHPRTLACGKATQQGRAPSRKMQTPKAAGAPESDPPGHWGMLRGRSMCAYSLLLVDHGTLATFRCFRRARRRGRCACARRRRARLWRVRGLDAPGRAPDPGPGTCPGRHDRGGDPGCL